MSLTEEDKTWIAELMSQKLEEVETRLLRAFRNFSHPVEARLRRRRSSAAAWTSGWTNLKTGSMEEGRGREESEGAQ